MANETTRKILRYTLTPQIVPRIGGLFFSGFSYVAFFMAQIYRAARLLPEGHPYLNTANMGRFGVRHVVAEAGSHLVFNKDNIDQIIIYVMMLMGMMILFAQVCMLGLALFIQNAYAFGGPSTFAAYFLVPDATHDIAYVILDRVFGVPDMFVDAARGTTCVVSGEPCFHLNQSSREITPDTIIYTDYERAGTHNLNFPWPFHEALHSMIEAYSVGLLLIAVFIFLYFAASVVAETAQSGTPFGRRFNHVWAPLRIVAAMGMLVPLTHGFNSAQYILMFAAKWGSGFATNGWIYFNTMAINGSQTLLGNTDSLVANPNAPPINNLVEFGSILATCIIAYERMYHERDDRRPVVIDAWLINPSGTNMDPVRLEDTGFEDAVRYFANGDIHVRFGELRDLEHQTRDGRVAPFCGELKLQLTAVPDDITGTNAEPGPTQILIDYYNLINQIWGDARQGQASCPYQTNTGGNISTGFFQQGCIGYNVSNRYLPIQNDPNAPLPHAAVLESIRESYQSMVNDSIQRGVEAQRNSGEWVEQLSQLGWGGAAIWYNKVAQLNGSLISASHSLPTIKNYPLVMEKVHRIKGGTDTDLPGQTRHQIYRGPDTVINLSDEEENQIAKALYAAQHVWRDHYSEQLKGGNIYIDIINSIFGTAGLFDIQRNADLGIHPLAQLAAIGRTIIDTSIRNLGYSAAAGLGGGIINLFGDHLVGRVAMTASSFLTQVAMVGFTVGFVLFYIIPLLPFIYFFFAVGGWVKGIFEAMVGVPLWALAHIRIDGNGLPGDAALGGYYLVLEVFLRPMCIIFGFLASITIFAAQVQVLHEIWPLVVSNATGFDVDAAKTKYNENQTGGMRFMRGAIDKFFFTCIYAIIIYMLGMSSFKLIDLIPNHILRWMGASVSTFGDQSGDPAQNLVRNAFVGANMVSGPVSGAIGGVKGAAQEGGKAVQELFGRSRG